MSLLSLEILIDTCLPVLTKSKVNTLSNEFNAKQDLYPKSNTKCPTNNNRKISYHVHNLDNK